MRLEVGAVVEGKVTGITKFGAFVSLPEGRSGLVHISEIADSFVNDVHDHVQEGQTVKVRVLSIADNGKINLSIKKAAEEQPHGQDKRAAASPQERPARPGKKPGIVSAPQAVNGPSSDQGFEDKLKKFMQESDSRIADNPFYSEHRQRSRRR